MRKVIIAISCCIVLLLLGYTGYRGYQVWKQSHLLAMAKDFSAKSDFRNELLCLQQVVAINPRNLEACRLMADLTGAARSPAALIWRQRIVELNPKSTEDRLALIQTAMIFKDFTTATNVLAGIDESGRNSPAYHNLAGVMAVQMGHVSEAEKHFGEAIRLEPSNPVPQVNLAVVRLHSSNTLDMAEARIDLKRISLNSTNFTLRAQATRELIMDAMLYKDISTATTLTQELVQSTNSVFEDKLLRLDVLKQAKSGELKPAIVQYQREAAADPAMVSQMSSWLMLRSTPASALTWLHTLTPQMQTNPSVAVLIAGCQVLVSDWSGLQNSVTNQNWSELDFIRHAFLARALRGQNLDAAATAEWEVAFKLASNQKAALIALFQLVAEWKWTNEAEEILWTVVNRYPEEQWAGPVLKTALYNGGRTRPLMQLFILQAKRSPTDMVLKNDLAMTAMLLDAQEFDPYGLSRTAYEQDPKNPAFISTYAYSLYLQKRYSEALKVMQQMSPRELSDPSVAGYYGLILKATGDSAKAKAYLGWTTKRQLLPEERKMFNEAMSN
jgi:Flp pilus assembly protein TadD